MPVFPSLAVTTGLSGRSWEIVPIGKKHRHLEEVFDDNPVKTNVTPRRANYGIVS